MFPAAQLVGMDAGGVSAVQFLNDPWSDGARGVVAYLARVDLVHLQEGITALHANLALEVDGLLGVPGGTAGLDNIPEDQVRTPSPEPLPSGSGVDSISRLISRLPSPADPDAPLHRRDPQRRPDNHRHPHRHASPDRQPVPAPSVYALVRSGPRRDPQPKPPNQDDGHLRVGADLQPCASPDPVLDFALRRVPRLSSGIRGIPSGGEHGGKNPNYGCSHRGSPGQALLVSMRQGDVSQRARSWRRMRWTGEACLSQGQYLVGSLLVPPIQPLH